MLRGVSMEKWETPNTSLSSRKLAAVIWDTSYSNIYQFWIKDLRYNLAHFCIYYRCFLTAYQMCYSRDENNETKKTANMKQA